jgi:general secretion pathway protein G
MNGIVDYSGICAQSRDVMRCALQSATERTPCHAARFGNLFLNEVWTMQMWTQRRIELAASRTRRQRGFTLIEIMVVIAILGILAALIVPKIMSRPDEARRVAAKQDIGSIMQALNLYRLDNGRYPTQEQGLPALISKPTTDPVPNNWKDGGYLDKLPSDPWGHTYQYLNPGVHGEIDVFSYGSDGKPGGDGNDADIGSWQ